LAAAAPGTPIRFIASTEGVKRDGKELLAQDWRLDNFRRNPVVLWVHDYMGNKLPIGRADVAIESQQLISDVEFDQADEFARSIESKYRRGFLNAVSVGWSDVAEGKRIMHDLMDVSAVPVPADPDALKAEQARALRAMLRDLETGHDRMAIPPHSTEKAPEAMAWDGPAAVAQCEETEQALRRMHAWVNEDADPATKRAYKLPHHLAAGQVVWRGVAAAMTRLLQAGTEIPDADREGVYRHLARHYQQFDKTPPEFRAIEELAAFGPEEWRGMFLEGEAENVPDPVSTRTGAVLSKRNSDKLRQAGQLIADVLASAEKEQPPAEPGVDGQGGEAAAQEAQRSAATLAELHKLFENFGGAR
jgi:hypothetical protein